MTMMPMKFDLCSKCLRSTEANPYCKNCNKPDGVAFPSFFILQTETVHAAEKPSYAPPYDRMAATRKKADFMIIDDIMEDAKEEAQEASDGSTASYYELPAGAEELQDLIAFKNMNAQLGEIFRAAYRYGQCPHSDRVREMNKVIFYAEAEINRLAKYEKQTTEEKEQGK